MKKQWHQIHLFGLATLVVTYADDAWGEITEQKVPSPLLQPLDKCANSHLGQQEGAMHICCPQRDFFVAEN